MISPDRRLCVAAAHDLLAGWCGPAWISTDSVDYAVIGRDRTCDRYLLVARTIPAPPALYVHHENMRLALDEEEARDQVLRVFARREQVEMGNSPPRWIRWESCGGTAWVLAGESWCPPDVDGGDRCTDDHGKWFYASSDGSNEVTPGLAEIDIADPDADLFALAVCFRGSRELDLTSLAMGRFHREMGQRPARKGREGSAVRREGSGVGAKKVTGSNRPEEP